MLFLPVVISLTCLVAGIAYLVYIKLKELELIASVTPLSRGEWSERMVIPCHSTPYSSLGGVCAKGDFGNHLTVDMKVWSRSVATENRWIVNVSSARSRPVAQLSGKIFNKSS